MRVTIGIPTYNRKEILKIMAASLKQSELGALCHIHVFDDCSNEFERDYLNRLFPSASSILINSKNLKSDRNIYQMYRDFLKSEDDYFFNADSDLIFNTDWLTKALKLIDRTDGILSLFNSNGHASIQTVDSDLCIKSSLGSAGTFFTRQRVEEIMTYFDSIEKVKGFDWQWSDYFNQRGIRLFCVNQSLVQHIGYQGQNSNIYFDYGRNYQITHIQEGQIINDVFEKFLDGARAIEKERTQLRAQQHAKQANDFWYHFKRCFIIMIKLILPKKVFRQMKSK